MQDDPLNLLFIMVVSLVIAIMWVGDFRAAAAGHSKPRSMPGAVRARGVVIVVAVLGALVLLAAETLGENVLGISEQQSTITALFACYTLLAAVVEEIIFRGFIVVENRGKTMLWSGIIVASLLFALLHPFLWSWEGGWPLVGNSPGHLTLNFGAKGWFSTVFAFVGSLWFYAMRFAPMNATRSLLPCIAAHLAKNAGVIAIKAIQGHLAGLW